MASRELTERAGAGGPKPEATGVLFPGETGGANIISIPPVHMGYPYPLFGV